MKTKLLMLSFAISLGLSAGVSAMSSCMAEYMACVERDNGVNEHACEVAYKICRAL